MATRNEIYAFATVIYLFVCNVGLYFSADIDFYG